MCQTGWKTLLSRVLFDESGVEQTHFLLCKASFTKVGLEDRVFLFIYSCEGFLFTVRPLANETCTRRKGHDVAAQPSAEIDYCWERNAATLTCDAALRAFSRLLPASLCFIPQCTSSCALSVRASLQRGWVKTSGSPRS